MKALTIMSLVLATSCLVLAGCGGNPKAGAEKAVQSFIAAVQKGDFATADKLVYTDGSDDATQWAQIKLLQPKLETASETQLKDLPWVPLLTCDFELLHHPTVETVLSAYQPDEATKAEMSLKDVSDMRVVAVKFQFKPRFAELARKAGGFKEGMLDGGVGGFLVAVKHKGTWKVGTEVGPLDIDLSTLK